MEACLKLIVESNTKDASFLEQFVLIFDGLSTNSAVLERLKKLIVDHNGLNEKEAAEHLEALNSGSESLTDLFAYEGGYQQDGRFIATIILGAQAEQHTKNILHIFHQCNLLNVRAHLKIDEVEMLGGIRQEVVLAEVLGGVDQKFFQWWHSDNDVLLLLVESQSQIEKKDSIGSDGDFEDVSFSAKMRSVEDVEREIGSIVSQSSYECVSLYGKWVPNRDLSTQAYKNSIRKKWKTMSRFERLLSGKNLDDAIESGIAFMDYAMKNAKLEVTADSFFRGVSSRYVVDSIEDGQINLRTLRYSAGDLQEQTITVLFMSDSQIELKIGSGVNAKSEFYDRFTNGAP